jgi:hypothetical protein
MPDALGRFDQLDNLRYRWLSNQKAKVLIFRNDHCDIVDMAHSHEMGPFDGEEDF